MSGRLLIDCMGNFSPIVRQARWGQRPDGVCLVVGSCCRGFTDNSTGTPQITASRSVCISHVQKLRAHPSALPAGACCWTA